MEAVNRRIVRTVTTAAPAEVLPGIAHTSLISPEERELSDPFLLMSDDRIDGGHGARVGGAHPHAGMESATLLLEGSIKDGDATPLQAGDLQWMTAGSGIVHDEAVIARGSVRLAGPRLDARTCISIRCPSAASRAWWCGSTAVARARWYHRRETRCR